jgi:2-methylcitrate dehydratase PrpD
VRAVQTIATGRIVMPDLLGGDTGFARLFGGESLATTALDGLGTSYALTAPGLALKTYPVCSAAQAAAQAVDELLVQEGLDGRDVVRVVCEVSQLVGQSLRFPGPQTVTEAQFSMPFAIGCLLAFGRLTPDLLRDDVLADARLASAMGRVEMVPAPVTGPYEALEGARVTVTCGDGRVFRCRKDAATGTAAAPMSDAELERKFEECARLALPPDEVGRRIAQLRALEAVASCDLVFDTSAR